MSLTVTRRRSGWDLVLGVLLVLAAIFVLGDVVLATAVSVALLAWSALFAGVVGLVIGLFRIGHPGFWTTILSGALLLVLGVVFLRNIGAAALTLTLLAGGLFLVSGITRLVGAVQVSSGYRWVLVVGGVISTLLGVMVLFNLFEFTFTLLGTLLGVQILVDGVSILVGGRLHVDSRKA